jgi:ABC-2 type transport system permease protein
MRGAWVIAEKDLRNLFMSPLFYVVAGVCTLTWSLLFYFSVDEFLYQSFMRMQNMGPERGEGGFNLHFTVFAKHISLVNLLAIFAIASVSMRLFTEEKRQRTFDLLLTAPVTATEIAIGKLIAGVATAWALIGVSLLYPLSLAFFGSLDWGPLLSSYIGLLLLTASYAAISMFTSSLTQNVVVSVLLSLSFNVMLWFVGAFAGAAETPAQKAVFEHLNVGTHFVNFIKGNVSLSGTVFFLSVVCLFTFLTQRVVESARWR